jgi:hypothetical protein
MGNVIYSASPLQAFLASVGTAALLLGLGMIGIVVVVVRRHQNAGARLAIGGAGLFLVLAGSAMIALTLVSKSSGPQMVSAVLARKQIARDTCGDNGETCPRYVLEATTGATTYDFDVPKGPYDRTEAGACYKFTYYPNKGLFSSDSASYQQINHLARIETADPATCQ